MHTAQRQFTLPPDHIGVDFAQETGPGPRRRLRRGDSGLTAARATARFEGRVISSCSDPYSSVADGSPENPAAARADFRNLVAEMEQIALEIVALLRRRRAENRIEVRRRMVD